MNDTYSYTEKQRFRNTIRHGFYKDFIVSFKQTKDNGSTGSATAIKETLIYFNLSARGRYLSTICGNALADTFQITVNGIPAQSTAQLSYLVSI